MSTETLAASSRRYFADYFWIGRGVMGTLCGVALLTSASTATSIWAVREARNAGKQAERVVIYVDGNMLPLGYAMAGVKWSPEARNYVSFARRWLIDLRSRPRDPGQLRFQYSEVDKAADSNLLERLKASRNEADRRVQTAAIDVDQVSVIMQDLGTDRATMRARWREQMRKPGEEPVVWNALMTVVYVRDKIAENNILGLYVLDFTPVADS